MFTRRLTRPSLLALILLAAMPLTAIAQPMTPAFTYQGELRDAEALFDGAADVRFTLWSAASAGSQIGAIQEALGVGVSGGRFAVVLNSGGEFGPAAFAGQRRWIEISVRNPSTGGVYQTLSPRQEVTLAPYAAYAMDAGTVGGQTAASLRNAANLTGTLPDGVLPTNVARLNATNGFSGPSFFSNPANTFTGTYFGSGAALDSLNATNLASGTVADTRLSANVALRTAANTFTGINTFSNSGNSFTGNGSGLFGLSASNVTSGLLDDTRLSANVVRKNIGQTFSASNTFLAQTLFNDTLGVGTAPNAAFRMQLFGGAGVWKGGIAAGGVTNSVVLGELNGLATIGGNNTAFTQWTDLAINPVGGRVSIGNGTAAPEATLQVATGTNALLTGGGYLVLGTGTGANLALDNNEIMARSNGVATSLHLNRGGGNVVVPALQFADGTTMNTAPSLPIVQVVTDPDLHVVGQGGYNTFTFTVPGARTGMGVVVNPTSALAAYDVISFARVSGFDTVQIRIQNTDQSVFGGTSTAYINTSWRVTLFPN